jgi:hypothetical protein
MQVQLLDTVQDFFVRRSVGARAAQVLVIFGFALLLIYLFDRLVERITPKVVQHTDNITTADNVLRLRRAETITGLMITLVRALLVIAALLLIWHVTNGGATSLALIGVGSVVVVLASATVVPLLRDITYGFIMIAERWYGVGDHIVIEPFAGSGGVVEKLTLRSTKLRSVNGEAIWWHHQHIQGVRVASAASHPLVVETFVNDPKAGRKVIEDAIKIIPTGYTTIPQPLAISEVKRISDKIWRITAVCDVTPFREWIIDDFAVKVIKKTDQLNNPEPVIVHGPIVYYADTTAEKRYRRSGKARQRVRNTIKK